MYICVCKAVSDRRVRASIQGGASSVRELSRELGVGTCCGKCVPAVRELLGQSLDQQPLRLSDLPAPVYASAGA